MNKSKPKIFDMAKNFTRYPTGRASVDGEYSGESFRKKVLIPAIDKKEKTEIHLDSAIGYGSSFLEEAFGGLIRVGKTKKQIDDFIVLITSDNSLKLEIENYISDAINNLDKKL